MGYEKDRIVLFKQAVLEYHNLGYWGFTLGFGKHSRKFAFENWDFMCHAINLKTFDSDIIISPSEYYRFWHLPPYQVSGRFSKIALY